MGKPKARRDAKPPAKTQRRPPKHKEASSSMHKSNWFDQSGIESKTFIDGKNPVVTSRKTPRM